MARATTWPAEQGTGQRGCVFNLNKRLRLRRPLGMRIVLTRQSLPHPLLGVNAKGLSAAAAHRGPFERLSRLRGRGSRREQASQPVAPRL